YVCVVSSSCVDDRSLRSFPTRRSSDLMAAALPAAGIMAGLVALLIGWVTLRLREEYLAIASLGAAEMIRFVFQNERWLADGVRGDRKSTRLNSSHVKISYAVFCLKKKN